MSTRDLLGLFLDGDYLEGLNQCESIKKPTSELLGWKAVFLCGTGKQSEGKSLMKEVLSHNIRNPVMWKLNSFLLRTCGDYHGALQAMSQSHKIDSSDQFVAEELSNLCLYERNIPLFLKHSRELYELQKSQENILRYSLALLMNGSIKECLALLDGFERQWKPSARVERDVEKSEIQLYHSRILLQNGQYEECLKYLSRPSNVILDGITMNEYRAKCYKALGNKHLVWKIVDELLAQYPENGDYFAMLEETMSTEEYILKLCSMKESSYAQVRILELIDPSDHRFEETLGYYLRTRKGGNLYTTLKSLTTEKLQYAARISQDVTTAKLLMANALLKEAKYKEALEQIGTTDSAPEIVSMRITILKKAGRLSEALALAAEGSDSDQEMAVRYSSLLLEAGNLEEATKIMEKYSRPDLKHKINLAIARKCAECCYRAGDFRNALTFCNEILTCFEDYKTAQYECFANDIIAISSIVDIIKWADDLSKVPSLGLALTLIMKIGFAQRDNSIIEPAAHQAVTCSDNEALSYASAYFASHNEPIMALKCYKKVHGAWKFALVAPMDLLLKSQATWPEVVQEVVRESYQPLQQTPQSFDDWQAVAHGLYFANEFASIPDILLRSLSFSHTFKQTRSCYTFAKHELQNLDVCKLIEKEMYE